MYKCISIFWKVLDSRTAISLDLMSSFIGVSCISIDITYHGMGANVLWPIMDIS